MTRLFSWLFGQAWFGQLRRHWRLEIAIIVVLYLIAGGVIARASYTQLTPANNLRLAVRFVPIPMVRVDQSFIGMGEYLERYNYIDSFIKKTATADFTPQKTRDQVIDYLVETRLITSLSKRQRVKVSGADINAAYEKLGNQPGVGGPTQIEQVLKELYGMTPAAFKRLLGEQLLRERVEQQVFLHVNARHILLGSQTDAERVIDALKSGTSFDDAAKQSSQDSKTRDQGGSLGNVGRGSGLPKPLEDQIFLLTPQSDLTIVQTDLGFHVLDTNERIGLIDQNFVDWLATQKRERSIAVYLPTTLDWAQPKK